jgi:predicted AAA+ superfamily ATPase
MSLIWEGGEAELRALDRDEPGSDELRRLRGAEEEHLRWGGYPALEWLPEGQRKAWLRDFRRTYLERDLGDLGRVADLDQFALAQSLLAARTGQLLSYSEISRELGLAVNTVKRYVHFLELSYQVVLLRPVLPNLTSRLVKSPKLYWTDPGLARVLAERPDMSDGAVFETAVCAELLRWRSWQEDPPDIGFHRTSAGREIDFVMHGPGRMLAIEAKAGMSVPAGVARSLNSFLEEVRLPGASRKAMRTGIVVYRGRAIRRLLPSVWAVPFSRLFGAASAG